MLEGGPLPPAPALSALAEEEYSLYARDMNKKEVRGAARIKPQLQACCLALLFSSHVVGAVLPSPLSLHPLQQHGC